MLKRLVILMGVCLVGLRAAAFDYVWFEAEDYDASNWPGGRTGNGPFAPGTDALKRMISGGVWLNEGKIDESREPLFIEKAITLPADGEYFFWARCFGHWQGGTRSTFRWRLDEGPWHVCEQQSGASVEYVKPTPVSTLSWIRFDQSVKAVKGQHRFRVEMLPPEDGKGFDCFVFSTPGFAPNGTLKPGEKLGLHEKGWWAFEPDPDAFSPDALLDLRGLNEKVAGQSGWVHLSKDGEQFLLGDGTPVRFWSAEVNSGGIGLADARTHMRFLAKRGINAVRVFASIGTDSAEEPPGNVNPKVREALWRTVAAARENGIYVLWTPLYYKTWVIHKTWGWKNYQKWNTHKEPRHAIFTDADAQAAYKAWMRAVLLEPNPHTGIPLAKDPALYCIQLQNEDSMFWSGVAWGLTAEGQRAMCRRFGDWLSTKYGSVEKAFAAWGGKPLAEVTEGFMADDTGKGEVGLPIAAYQMTGRWLPNALRMVKTNPGTEALMARANDAIEFLADFQRGFNNGMRDFIQKDLGYQGLISANNWKSNDQITLDDVERYTYDGCEVIDAHKYVGFQHINPTDAEKAGYQINAGDLYVDDSALHDPSKLPDVYKMVEGHPNIITESSWVPPMSHQSEGPLLVAAYGALTGLDGFNWFAIGGTGWATTQGKWAVNTPAVQGGFPAAALLYRRGDVSEPRPVVYQERPLKDLWQRRVPLIAESETYDPNVNPAYVSGESPVTGGVDPMAFHVGPVRVRYGGDPAHNAVSDRIGSCFNRDAKWVKSINGEIMLDYGKGLFTCDTPRTQAVTGFLQANGGTYRLSGVTIVSTDDYATVIVTSLDDRALKDSRKVLVQVTTESRPYGWSEESGTFTHKDSRGQAQSLTGEKITSIGTMPWNMKDSHVSVTVSDAALSKATLLDADGMAVKELPVTRTGDGLKVLLPPDVLYAVLR